MDNFEGIGAFFLDIVETIVVALAIFVVIYLFLFQPHQVKGSSMDPTFHDGQYILTDKISYKLGKPNRGDVIIFKAPKNPDLDYIKRVIALPGERVKVSNGFVYINNRKLDEPYLPSTTILFPGSFLKENQDYVVQTDEYMAFGDNRNHSSDSREWGPVPKKDIIGRAFIRYWPPPAMGLIKKPAYTF